ncbi:MAG: M3 family oligoendopeptidase [Sphaerochaetaceae bacterium]
MLPHWSLDSIYPSLESDLFKKDFSLIKNLSESLSVKTEKSSPLTEDDFKNLLNDYNNLADVVETLGAYAYALLSVDTNSEKAMAAVNKIEEEAVLAKVAHVKVVNFLDKNREAVLRLVKGSSALYDYEFVIKELLEEKKHTLSEELESLAADLNRSGSDAFSRLQESLSSNSTTAWAENEIKSVIQLRALAFDSDRSVRERAFKAELKLWEQDKIAFAASLNSVKGTTLTLDKKRSYSSPLERSVKQSRITEEILNALISTIEDNRSVFVKYLKAKAYALNLEKLAFYDLFAPVGKSSKRYSYQEAQEFIIKNFSDFHKDLGEFAKMAFEKNWIDSESRVAKVGGAYCTSFPLRKEIRILANYDYSYDSVSTIAHELGHGYHDYVTNKLPALLRSYPVTLAETASIFSQVIVFKGALKEATQSEKITLIESFLQDATQTCIDILSRYYFEKTVFEKREEGELSPNQFCEIMKQAQKEAYREGLDENALHPYMWAVKGHYYRSDLSFYNYPYAFGLLFGLGVFNLRESYNGDFAQLYDSLLYKTGQLNANDVALSVNLEISKKQFWQQGIDLIASYVDEFVTLVGYVGA